MEYSKEKRLLIIHPTIAPYRIDFFNCLNNVFETKICLQYWNLKDQKFDYQKIYDQFDFNPFYLPDNSTRALCNAVRQQIRDFEPDIVMTCEYGPVTMTVLLMKLFSRKRFKVLVMTDDSYDMVNGGNDFSMRHRIARILMAPHVDDFLVVEPRVEQWYQNKYGKSICFPIIVDDVKAETHYRQLLPLSTELIEKYGLVGKKVLLSVSRLVDLKNLHRVIDAFAMSKTDATLVIVGDGPERESIIEHASQVDKEIIIPGRFDGDELYAWYNIASVFILASYKEPFGAVTNEALLAGCRVVVSEKAGSSCLVNEDNGEIIDPMDVNGISNAIDRQMMLAFAPDMKIARKNLMKISFEERMDNLIHIIGV